MKVFNGLEEHFNRLRACEDYIQFFEEFAKKQHSISPSELKEVIEKVIEITQTCHYEYAQMCILNWLAWGYSSLNEYKKAIEYRMQALFYFKKHKEKKRLPAIYNGLLADYLKLGEFDLAITYGLEGIKCANDLETMEVLTALIMNTAQVYILMEEYDKSLEMMALLESGFYELLTQHKITINHMKSLARFELGDVEAAYELCTENLGYLQDGSYKIYEAQVLCQIGIIKCRRGDYEGADQEFEAACVSALACKMELSYISVLSEWAKCYLQRENAVEAEVKLRQAYERVAQTELVIEKKDIEYQLSQVYKKLGRFEEAFVFLEKSYLYHQNQSTYKSSIYMSRLQNHHKIQEVEVYKLLYDQMNLVSEVGKKITSNLKIEHALEAIYKAVNELLDVDEVGIALYDATERMLDYKLFVDKEEYLDLGKVSIDAEYSFGGYCIRNNKDIVINDIEDEYSQYVKYVKYVKNDARLSSLGKPPVCSAIFSPLIIEDRIIGVMMLQSYKKHTYNVEDLKKLKTLTTYVAIALENAKLFDEVKYLANYDGLTGVLNRREIMKRGEVNLETNREAGVGTGVIMLDIDHFKQINDQYGHIVGDKVLKEIARIAKDNIRSTDLIGRYGGEEFLIILSHVDQETAKAKAEQIRELIESYAFVTDEGMGVAVTGSLGVAMCKGKEGLVDTIKRADGYLYESKRLGRNRVTYEIQYKGVQDE